MKRIRTYRLWHITTRVTYGFLMLYLLLVVLKVLVFYSIALFLPFVVLIALSCELFSKACPFCNRQLPEYVFRKPSVCTCEFCGREVNIV